MMKEKRRGTTWGEKRTLLPLLPRLEKSPGGHRKIKMQTTRGRKAANACEGVFIFLESRNIFTASLL